MRWLALVTIVVAAWLLPRPVSASVPPFWQRLANCETGGRWDWGAQHRPGEGRTYEGGVGFYASTWTMWASALGLAWRFPHAYLAPPEVQVRVAVYGLAHRGYWGCLARVRT